MKSKKIKSNVSATDLNTSTILGEFEGECADGRITNANGLDITDAVWETVFNSDDYKQGIDLGWYIGFLGHPEDPDCQDFEHACIVMTSGRIDSDTGKVYGTFNLIDTPVGRIAKAFIDSGVTFGISVRGAGEIENNSVDPDTFVFRGFDLVAWPAYPNAIPTFTELAASTNMESRKKYSKVCAAVSDNLEGLNTCEAVEIVQKQFAPQSKEYQMLEEHKIALAENEDVTGSDPVSSVLHMYANLYSDYMGKVDECDALVAKHRKDMERADFQANRKLKSVRRIMSAQLQDLQNDLADQEQNLRKSVQACRQLGQKYKKLDSVNASINNELNSIKNAYSKINLKYKKEIEANTASDADLRNVESELSETVKELDVTKRKLSNFDKENQSLRESVRASQDLLQEYQVAYADLYCKITGIDCNSIPINATTSVADIRRHIEGRSTVVDYCADTCVDSIDVDDISDDGLITT